MPDFLTVYEKFADEKQILTIDLSAALGTNEIISSAVASITNENGDSIDMVGDVLNDDTNITIALEDSVVGTYILVFTVVTSVGNVKQEKIKVVVE